ncbi:MAG: glycosyltransferase family 4 protein [Candidatus Moraniibacteriota bacterium]|nr:MAG: glycosyltransferase family 4 protein [Candidatus Moranbacteria bacterium]
MYRIGINASFLRKPYTGIGQVTVNVLREISKRDFYIFAHNKRVDAKDVSFFLYLEKDEATGVSKSFLKRVPEVVYKRDDLIRKWLFEKWAIPKQAKKDTLDAFISLYQSATTFSSFSRISHAMVVHDIIPEVVDGYTNNMRKRFSWKSVKSGIKKSDRILSVSKHTEKDLIQKLNIAPDKISLALIAVNPLFSEPVTKEKASLVRNHYALPKQYFFYSGGFEVRKNVESVIRAYKLLADDDGDRRSIPHLVLSGTLLPHLAPLIVDVETLVRELGLRDRVKILGNVPQNDISALYSESMCFIFPSLYEGFGMPVLEAMYAGTPVITTKKTSLGEVAGDAARYCDGSINGIADAMREIMKDENLRKELRRRGILRSQLFSWERFVDILFANVKV